MLAFLYTFRRMITDDLELAASHIRNGRIVAFPTETVWGLGANAFDHIACQKIYQIKGRPLDNPLILHLDQLSSIPKYGWIEPELLKKIERWIPGPLTLILKKKEEGLFSCGLRTIAVRVPQEPKGFMEKCCLPVAAPSANLSGKPSLTRFLDVVDYFESKVDCILKGMSPSHGIESTVIDLSKEKPIYVRPGVISFEEIQSVLPEIQKWNGAGPIISTGIKYRHYSPDGTVILLSDMEEVKEESTSGQIGFNLIRDAQLNHCVKDNVHYAKDLYAFFVECDKLKLKKVYCQIPKEGVLYQAILHRLEKAAYK